ncbi:hypothetical protein PV05_01548 [Exophiala xenobiotica]|uniref:Alpha/beta hydrolase fold-3 domain-containing protein n=1 Tax=Exophiala xenobiotica TaxID=348802 RepID=A0A0D2DGJ3_9EURO|nr:uncharacterized protein PV05_01548 [Exophiala xenobiotica]KIW61427.1 hypothetical protein PV05_01548 [Exophiala xenobiotica]
MAPRSPEELDALAIIDPEIDAVLKSGKLPIPKLDLSSVEAGIQQLRSLEALFPPAPAIPEVAESSRKFTTRDGTELSLHVFHQASPAPGPKPLVIYFHGGGGCMGNPYSVANLARDLAVAHNCVVVSPQYRLAPEHPWPAGVHDAWDAFEHISTNADSVSADVSAGLVVGGVSQGARLASLIALQAKASTTTPKITGLYFDAPSFMNPDSVPAEYKARYRSRTDGRCLKAPILDADTKVLFDKAYKADQTSPLYAALNTTPLSKHADVAPKAYFSICGMDMLRDDGLIYADILENLGVQTRTNVYPGTPHVFWSVFSWIKQAQKWKADRTAGLGWLLGRE